MIKAIIFDCFGVLTTDAWIAFKKRHLRHDGKKATQASMLNRLAGAGQLSYRDFLERISTLAGMSAADTQKEINTNTADEELFDYIKTLKPEYKIGMLSNAAANHLSRLFTHEQVDMFNEIVLSYESEVIKPDIRAYKLIARKLGVAPAECIFVDDQQKHCDGAKKAGMQTILYKDFASFKKELEEILTAGSDN
jgi:epoxide hydrolase-like predicted phosphatase